MKITEIINRSERPALYEPATAFMWTDEHISKQILNVHLNPDIDLASRKQSTILKTANWILHSQKEKTGLNILDLGCGPGLYTEIFAEHGHHVTGVDISKNSIDYARKSAKEKNLDIEYINASYLDIDLESEKFDLVVLIYTDLGVLIPEDRESLLSLVFKVLKKGGTFIFDVLKDHQMEQKVTLKTWEAANVGFWKDAPYILLSDSFLYKEEKVILFQHNIIDAEMNVETFRFWTHFFSQKDLKRMMKKQGFNTIQFIDDILPKEDKWNGDSVIFSIVKK